MKSNRFKKSMLNWSARSSCWCFMNNVAKDSAASSNLKKINRKKKNLKKITNACDEIIDKIQKLAETRKIWKKK